MMKAQLYILVAVVAFVAASLSCDTKTATTGDGGAYVAQEQEPYHSRIEEARRVHDSMPPAPTPPPDTRTRDQIVAAACTARDGSWTCPKVAHPPKFGASGVQPIIPASWTVPTWFVDTGNASGTASDSNDCATITTPCLTWHEINDHRWGCYGSPSECPRLRQNTSIEWLSDAPSEEVYFLPALENGATAQMFGAPGASTTTTFATFTAGGAPSRTALTQASPTAGTFAAGTFVANTTHAGAAWAYTVVSGATWNLSQPTTRTTTATQSAFTHPTEVTTWANGDTISITPTPIKVNIVAAIPTVTSLPASTADWLQINNLYIVSPPGTGGFYQMVQVNTCVSIQEIRSDRVVYALQNGPCTYIGWNNNYFKNGLAGWINPQQPEVVWGGVMRELFPPYWYWFDGDVIMDAQASSAQLFDIVMGAVYMTNGTFAVHNYLDLAGDSFIPSVVWGDGHINVAGSSRINYRSGAGFAVSTFKFDPKINSQTLFCIGNPAASVTTLTCNIALTAANLDAQLGATVTGCASFVGGGSICNTGAY